MALVKINICKVFVVSLKECLFNTYKFPNHDSNRFILLLRKGVYPYEYMDDWKKFNGTSLHEEEKFYSHLNMENITDADNGLAERVHKGFEMKNLEEYHELHIQSDTLTLEKCILKYMNSILQNFVQLLD